MPKVYKGKVRAGLRGKGKSTVLFKNKMNYKPKRKCHCGCGKCK